MSHRDEGKKLSILADRFVPKFVREEHPQFVIFIKKYFEYLEQDLGEYDVIAHLLEYTDIDTTVPAFLDEYKKQYGPNIPESISANLILMLKNIRSFYQSKGTEKSYKFLFKAIFNTFVNFYYPKIDILRASDGKWLQPLYLVVTPDDNPTLAQFIDKKIVGGTSTSEAYIEKTIIITYDGGPRTALSLLSVAGQFQAGEDITIKDDLGSPVLTIESSPTGVIAGDGRWEGTDGFLSWDKYLQDNYYYQEFSYVLKTNISIDYYKKIIEENVHPAGFKFFGEVTALDYLPVNLPALLTTVYWIIAWLEMSVAAVSEGYHITEHILRYNKDQGHGYYDWEYFEDNREDRPMVNLFPTIGGFDVVPIEDFQIHRAKHSCIVSLDGVKIDYDDYDVYNKDIIFSSAPAAGNLTVHYLNNPQYHPERWVGDNATNTWTLGHIPVGGPNALLVYVNGIKLRKLTEYFLTGGNVINFVATPATDDIVEVIYLEEDNYLGLNTNLFVGDGSNKMFTLTQNVHKQREYNTIVSIDGVSLRPREDYLVQNGQLVIDYFDIAAPANLSNIEIVFMKDTNERNIFFLSDGTATIYTINKVPDIFYHVPESYVVISP